MITRSIGGCFQGYIYGGGYEGKTKELDDIILKAADLMQKAFNTDITIRYNSDRESGGAWIKDNSSSAIIGLNARMAKSQFNNMTTEQKINITTEEYNNLPFDMIVIDTVIEKSVLANENHVNLCSICCTDHNSLEDGIAWILEVTDTNKVTEYLKNVV